MTSLSERAMAVLVGLLPPGRRDLGRGLLAEAAAVPAGARRWAWLVGGVWFIVKEGVMRIIGYALALLAAAAAVVAVDRIGNSDDAAQVSLLVLLLASMALGFIAPRRAWVAGLVLGAAIALANMVYVEWGPARVHPIEPSGLGGAATLLILVVPATIAAYIGAGTAWLLQRSRGR